MPHTALDTSRLAVRKLYPDARLTMSARPDGPVYFVPARGQILRVAAPGRSRSQAWRNAQIAAFRERKKDRY